MVERMRRPLRVFDRRFRTVWAFLALPLAAAAQDIEHAGMFGSLATHSMSGVYEADEVVVADFGGRAVVAGEAIELLVNDPWNRLWPLALALEFFSVPIDIRWTSANRIYVELDEIGWELLYSTGLGPELWKPIGAHPKSSASGKGWVVDLSGETSPALFRGRSTE